ncbi:META domain-containing protein [Gluconobacter cerinus]|uniref:META domain-containing protein n=1 Tax=Gluconobacter cerinus TaxID=38307 RepID=UPI001B8D3B1D|nr:META domain-containing protein [Gluconobacter cerinus]MBS1024338.1 META domain-containing protein [Gluconobacter cerinus]MBS1043622.1 META domain-containing protein [Gluconobacter cerinus]
MITRRFALSLVAGSAFVQMAKAEPLETLSGTVTYRERMALPAGAVLTVQLEDISRADAPAITLAESRQDILRPGPIAYTLRYPALKSGFRHALRAEIRVGDTLLFTTEDFHGPDQPNILVHRVSAPAASSPYGTWSVQALDGKPLEPTARKPVLTLNQNGRVSGFGGCNRLMGHVVIKGNTIRFAPMAMTRMACIGSGMGVESHFVKNLEDVRSWSIGQRGELTLNSQSGIAIIVLTSADIDSQKL